MHTPPFGLLVQLQPTEIFAGGTPRANANGMRYFLRTVLARGYSRVRVACDGISRRTAA